MRFVTQNDDSQKYMQCANCGGCGHIYKNCNHPITSYGVICFQLTYDRFMNLVPKYLMVQRKDSLSFVEFMRGKYHIEQKAYLMRLFSNMTPHERDALRTKTFDELWKALWLSEDSRGFLREHNEAKARYEMLKRGCIMKNEHNEMFYFDINYILDNTVCTLAEPEWGFPKGRRNINEHDLVTALRECKEESGLEPQSIHIINNVKPFEEVFSGTNRVRYKHVYYLGFCAKSRKDLFNPNNKHQQREIKDVKWFNYENSQSRIRSHNVERKELLKRVHMLISKNLSTHTNNCYNYNSYEKPSTSFARIGFL